MKKALIGFTGFVGSNLFSQGNYTHSYNHSNISDIKDQFFDEIWCAGVRAVKWWANQNPTDDWTEINILLDALSTVTCNHFVLISTVDVFKNPVKVNEYTLPEPDGLHSYGLHRLRVEDFVTRHFKNVSIIRLPGLFGNGLKKNVIYDFLHNNQLDNIHSQASFQFYDLSTIHADCQKALQNNLPLVHFAVEPITVKTLAKEVFGRDFDNLPGSLAASYDLQTIYAEKWGTCGNYLQGQQEILAKMRCFVQEQRSQI